MFMLHKPHQSTRADLKYQSEKQLFVYIDNWTKKEQVVLSFKIVLGLQN